MRAGNPYIELRFSSVDGAACAELTRCSFSHPLLEEPLRKSSRGRYSGPEMAELVFQWSTAVKAMCVLFLETKAAALESLEKRPELRGTNGSLASSLDDALSKKTNWITDVFGNDSKGAPIARRVLKRTNAKRKRPGPVSVYVSSSISSPDQIQVFLDNALVDSVGSLLQLASEIERSCNKRKKTYNAPARKPQKEALGLEEVFFEDAISEVRKGIWIDDIFTRSGQKRIVKRISDTPFFRRLAGKGISELSSLPEPRYPSEWLGYSDNQHLAAKILGGDKPLNVIVPAPCISSLSFFRHLQIHRNYNININYNYPHTLEVCNRLLNNELNSEPELIVFGNAPSARILGHPKNFGYHPVLPLPSITHEILAPASAAGQPDSAIRHGKYALLKEDPSTPAFFLDELQRRGVLDDSAVEVVHSEVDHTWNLLAEQDPELRSILFFPYYSLNRALNGAVTLSSAGLEGRYQEILLWAHESLLQDTERFELLLIALRDTWLRFRESEALVQKTIQSLLDDEDFMMALGRFSGFSLYANQANE